jgi:hypothetical protein
LSGKRLSLKRGSKNKKQQNGDFVTVFVVSEKVELMRVFVLLERDAH